jgi:hypothetical protein
MDMGEEDGFWDGLETAARGGKPIQLVLHDDPDPDALISAYAVQQYCGDAYGATPAIYYAGRINGEQNQYLADKLVLPDIAHRYDTEDFADTGTTYTVLMDNEGGSNVTALGDGMLPETRVDAIIDHHNPDRKVLDRYSLPDDRVVIRDDVGSTATMVARHLMEAGYFETQPDDRLAAFLRFAIETDTLGTYNAYPADETVYEDLAEYEDQSLHSALTRSRERPKHGRMVDDAADDEQHIEILSLGMQDSDDPDPFRAADTELKRLLREDPDKDVYVIVYGLDGNGDGQSIELSARVRSTGDNFNIDEYLAQMGEPGEQYCGGKSGPRIHEGAGSIPIDAFEQSLDSDNLEDVNLDEQFGELLHATYIADDGTAVEE